jgi:hypothetical protein
MRTQQAVTWVLLGIPVATLLGAYGWLALDHGTPALLGTVVHESGRRTLADTVLYWRHLLRELPLAGAYVVSSLAAVVAYGPCRTSAPSSRGRAAALGGAVLVVAVAWAAATRSLGADVVWLELRQSYLDDGGASQPGAHWRFHLLATFAYAAAAVVLAAVLRRVVDGAWCAPTRTARTRAISLLAIAVLLPTGLWGLTADPFVDPRYLGHQAREVATHLVVTLPLSFAVLAIVGGWRAAPATTERRSRPPRDVAIAAVAVAIAVAYLGLGSFLTHATQAARPGARMSSLIGAHYYEHGLDYLLVVLLAVAFAPASREDRRAS